MRSTWTIRMEVVGRASASESTGEALTIPHHVGIFALPHRLFSFVFSSRWIPNAGGQSPLWSIMIAEEARAWLCRTAARMIATVGNMAMISYIVRFQLRVLTDVSGWCWLERESENKVRGAREAVFASEL